MSTQFQSALSRTVYSTDAGSGMRTRPAGATWMRLTTCSVGTDGQPESRFALIAA